MTQAVLLRIGIDSGSGGIQGPLFQDGTFEYIPPSDKFKVDERTYGNMTGAHGHPLIDYFPSSLHSRMINQSVHLDPEFATFTYGDPNQMKSSLKNLQEKDMLIFYCGLEGWDFECEPALYLVGYFEVSAAGRAESFSPSRLQALFGENFHVRHQRIFEMQKSSLILVKGSMESRLLKKAVLLSYKGCDKIGKPLKVLSEEMKEIFGTFGGKNSIQRCPPRWVSPGYVDKAIEFVRSCE